MKKISCIFLSSLVIASGVFTMPLSAAVKYGDLDKDDNITSNDISILKSALLGKSVLTDEQNICADVSGDQVVNSIDLAYMKKYILQKISMFPAEQKSQTTVNPDDLKNNLDVAFNFTDKLNEKDNYMISPFSLKMAFAMLANGTNDAAKNEILKAIGNLKLQEYNEFSSNIIKRFNVKDSHITAANSLWLNTDAYKGLEVNFKQSFTDCIEAYYGGTAEKVDNTTAVNTINSWISEKTNNKINNVISNPLFLACLVNTIYFKDNWQQQFLQVATRKADFMNQNGQVVKTDFMYDIRNTGYYEDDQMQMVRLPYANTPASMYLILQKTPTKLTGEYVSQAIKNMLPIRVTLEIPKFKTEYQIKDAIKMLSELGIKTVFNPQSYALNDGMFENVPETDSIYVGDVIHKTFIDVNENGTEAAAATVIIAPASTAPTQSKEFTANHPFTYLIMDDVSNEVLFTGQVSNFTGN